MIVGVVGSLNFANASRTTQALQDLVEKAQKEDDASKVSVWWSHRSSKLVVITENPSSSSSLSLSQLRYFLLDLSGVSLIDLSACVGLSLLQKNILQRKMKLVIVGANGEITCSVQSGFGTVTSSFSRQTVGAAGDVQSL